MDDPLKPFEGRNWQQLCADISEYEAGKGGRKEITVGEMITLLSKVDPSLPFKVSHQPRYQHVRIQDPLIDGVQEIATMAAIGERGEPILERTGLQYFIVE